MPGGWTRHEQLLNGAAQAVGASQTKQVVSREFRLTSGGATEALRVDLTLSSVTVAADVIVYLQMLVNGTWTDVKSDNTLVTAGTTLTILMHENVAADNVLMPLTDRARIVVTTGAGDAVTVNSIMVYQEQ